MKRKLAIMLVLSMLAVTSCVKGGGSHNNTSSEPDEVVSETFNTYNCVAKMVNAANKYSEDVTVDGVLAQLKASGEDIDVKKSSDALVSEVAAVLALYYTFKDVLPAKIGARSFQALDFNVDNVEIRSVKDSSKTGPIYTAMKALSSYGFFTTPRSGTVSGGKAVTEAKINTYLDRIHYYIGESYTDDFFATVNHDYLYDNNPYQNAPSDGHLVPGDTSEDLTHIYDSKLIPESEIADFILDIQSDIPTVKNFIDTYSDFDARVAGNSAGLVASVNKYLAATTIEQFIELLRTQVQEEGYCPLWGEATAGNYTFTNGSGRTLLNVEPFSYSADSPGAVAPGSSKYNESVNRFKPIFQEVLGCSDAQAQTYAENYSGFKWKLAVNQAAWKAPDSSTSASYAFLTDDAEQAQTSNYYTNAGFAKTGETLYSFFSSLGITNLGSVMVSSRQDMESILALFTDENLDYLKGLVIWQMLYHYSICLPATEKVTEWLYKPGYANNKATLVDNKDIFYSKVYNYVSGNISNYWTGTTQFASDSAAVIGVVNGIKSAMTSRISEATWLSSDARTKAQSKVDNMKYVVGGAVSDNTTLSFPNLAYKAKGTGSLYGNIAIAEDADWETMAPRIGTDWTTADLATTFSAYDPLTANAFYYPSLNAIYITLGYMACYDNAGSANDLQLYSDYGWVVAHEISHGFDSSGIYYDQDGKYYKKGWFNSADQNAYSARTKAVANYYDGYEVMPDTATKGSTVITEAIADINGLHLVMEAVKNKSNFDYRQFFINCADNFGAYSSKYTYTSELATDEHPFGRARVNLAMMAIDEWHTAFETKPGDNMWVAPEDRILVW